jgi:DNA-binding CsgD family transcriptional regulator
MPTDDRLSPELLWEVLLSSIQEGVIVVSPSLHLIYSNSQANLICQQFQQSDERSPLPSAIASACHRFLQFPAKFSEPLIVEYQEQPEQLVRLQIRWLSFGETVGSYLLVLLEDCHQSLRQEVLFEKLKYDLTDREAEVWMLLRQEFTYEQISKKLQISLNTVKTHAKNSYAKRNSLKGQQQIWYSR